MYIPGDENSVDMDERLGNYEDGVWVGPPLVDNDMHSVHVDLWDNRDKTDSKLST
jgi:hypothetical protein